MDTASFPGLLNNAILLLALGVIYEVMDLGALPNHRLRQVVSGTLVGVIGIAVMLTPWEFVPGIFFDTRWILISICGLFFGWLPTLIAGVIMLMFRLYQGGGGAVVGSIVIIATAFTGLGWRYIAQYRGWHIGGVQLYLFGVTVQCVMLTCILLMPADLRWTIIQSTALPILIIFPLATLLLGLILRRQDQLRSAHEEIRYKNTVLSTQQEASEEGILAVNNGGDILSWNGRLKALWQLPEAIIQTESETELFGHQLEQVAHPRLFATWISRMQRNPYEHGSEVVSLKDGRVLECYSAALISEEGDHYGRFWSYRDITQRKQMEDELVRQRNQAANILDGTNAGTWHWDIVGGQLEIDERMAAIMGYELADLMPLDVDTWRSLIHPEDIALVEAALAKHFAHEADYYDVEFRQRKKEGGWFWVNSRGKVMEWSANGSPLTMSGTHLDISQRKQIEQELRDSETLFRNSFDVSPIASSIAATNDGRYLAVNHAYIATFGWSEEELLAGKSTTIGLWPCKADRDAWLAEMKETGFVYDYSVRMSDSTGRQLDVELSACLIEYAGESCVLAMLHDVTARKQAEVEIRERESRYRTLFDSAEISIWNEDFTELMKALQLLRDQGVTDLRRYLTDRPEVIRELAGLIKVLHVNQATLELFGAENEGAFIHSIDRTFVEDTAAVFIEELSAIWEGRSYFRSEATFRKLDGQEITGLISMPISVREEEMRNVPVSILDITDRVKTEQALAASQSLYRTILESMNEVGEGLLIVGAEGRIDYMNQTMIDWFGEQTGLPCLESVAALDPDANYSPVPIFSGKQRVVQYLSSRSQGQDFEVVSAPVQNRDGSVSRLEIIRDITSRRRSEELIRTLSQAVEQSPVSVVITDIDGIIDYVNSAFERITGYESAEVVGQHTRMMQSGNTPTSQYEQLWQTITSGKTWQGEFQNKKKNGELFWERAYIAPVLDEKGAIKQFLAVKEDVTLQKEQEERILRQAHYDNLTGMPNRFLALDRLSQLIKDAGRSDHQVAVLFLDMDDFKKVNDTMGHETGDQLLQQAASRLRTVVREFDTVGRLGGDEFIILLGGLSNVSNAQQVAEQILEQFRQPFSLQGRELVLTASLGIAIYPEDGATAVELLRNADMAMYHSKEAGRNTYHYFTESMNQGVARRLILEEQLRGAMGRGELSICYQPLIEISNRSMVGVEALLRWTNPLLGVVSPAEFIPIAEQTGLIAPIGEYVIEQALSQLVQWQQASGQSLKMAVNISPRQFRDPQLAPFIQQALLQAGVEPTALELEITEGVLMSGHGYIDKALEALSTLGVKISMDDFGTGYSSLSYLRSYPFDILKIDQSFIRDITVDEEDRELVNAAIAMAHGLGLKVVAEGVETEEQLAHLVEKDCDFAQGYLFSKPVSGKSIEQLLLASSTLFAQSMH
jgi:diguanylate cyclase (GGDEF)-like protein/PAS domain S-box-containing protein